MVRTEENQDQKENARFPVPFIHYSEHITRQMGTLSTSLNQTALRNFPEAQTATRSPLSPPAPSLYP